MKKFRSKEEALTYYKKHTLVLTQTADKSSDMMFSAWLEYGLNADIIFKSYPKPIRAIRRLWADGYIPGASIWYGDWKSSMNDYETVIVHADERTRTVPGWIHKNYPNIRIIYWYWNPVNDKSLPSLTNTSGIELWSFDSNDCKKYEMKQNIQYYYTVRNLTQIKPEYDLYFIGHDKGRRDEIQRVTQYFKSLGYTSRVDLVGDDDQLIPYKEVQSRIAKSRAILEINQKGQSGYTLRTLESLFFNKKLITTNEAIYSEEFYRPENVFVLNKDDDLKKFMETPVVDVTEYKKKHDIDMWFWNFIKDQCEITA